MQPIEPIEATDSLSAQPDEAVQTAKTNQASTNEDTRRKRQSPKKVWKPVQPVLINEMVKDIQTYNETKKNLKHHERSKSTPHQIYS